MSNIPVLSNSGLSATTSDPMTMPSSGAANANVAEQPIGQAFGNILGKALVVEDDIATEDLAPASPVETLMTGVMITPPINEFQSVPEVTPEELLSMLPTNVITDADYPITDSTDTLTEAIPLSAATLASQSPVFGNLTQPTTTSLQTINPTYTATSPAKLTTGNNSANTFTSTSTNSLVNQGSEYADSIRLELIEGDIQQGFDKLNLNGKLSDLANGQATGTANFADSGKILPSSMAVHAGSTSLIDSAGAANDAPVISTEFGHSDWPEEFGQKITWLATQRMQSAELKLHPAHLGPIEISLQISADQQLTAHFTSHHAGVRDAIEANLPKLREIMAENGITLADTSVSADTPGQQAESGQQSPRRSTANDRFHYDSAAPQTSMLQVVRRSSIIDTFA